MQTVAPDQLPTSRFAELDHREVARFYAVNWLHAVMTWNTVQAIRMAVKIDRITSAYNRRTPPVASSAGPEAPGPAPGASVWTRLAQCESSGDWASTVGSFEGGLQFDNGTWLAYGGGAYAQHAYDATPAQQIAVAERVLASQGPSAWPVCSHRAGLR